MKIPTVFSLLLAVALLAGSSPLAFAANTVHPLTAYPVPGSPFRVAVQEPGRVWFTLPAQNAIGRLVVTTTGTYDVRSYQLPTAASQPYDIVYSAGLVWVTEQAGNKIARFDPLAETWTEYPIPTSNSQPTGIAVLAGDPVQAWFCEQEGNTLGQLTVTGAGVSQFAEFPLPLSGTDLESVAATSSENVWFTAPGRSLIGLFVLSLWLPPRPGNPDPGGAFGFVPTGAGSRPHDIKLGAGNLPWFTEPTSNRIGRFSPATTTSFEWYPVQTLDSGLAGLDLALGYTWFTERNSGRIGRLQKVGFEGKIREVLLPGANPAPTDIAVGPDGCAWVSASGTHELVSWCAPYFEQVYLPLIRR